MQCFKVLPAPRGLARSLSSTARKLSLSFLLSPHSRPTGRHNHLGEKCHASSPAVDVLILVLVVLQHLVKSPPPILSPRSIPTSDQKRSLDLGQRISSVRHKCLLQRVVFSFVYQQLLLHSALPTHDNQTPEHRTRTTPYRSNRSNSSNLCCQR